MAFDGIVIAALTDEIKKKIEGGKINKIAQPEKDELLFTIKNNRESYRLLLSASASLPLAYFTDTNKPGPMTAPGFCMLLRKHIGTGRIIEVTQPGLERIIRFEIEHLDEMGDLRRKYLIVELMGKHSNIIFCDETFHIIDSIKHISAQVSSVREVLPGREYFIPNTEDKADPLTITMEDFCLILKSRPSSLHKSLYQSLTGISPLISTQLCFLAGIDGDRSTSDLSEIEYTHLYHMLKNLMEDVKCADFHPQILYEGNTPAEFCVIPLTCFSGEQYHVQDFDDVSSLLEFYYASKNAVTRIRQKSADLRRIVQTALERCCRKYELQEKQLRDTEKKDKYKLYGELLNTFGYELKGGEKEYICQNYYTGENVRIPLDPTLSSKDNAKKYFDKYGKLKRTAEALNGLTEETRNEITHLESIHTALDIALKEEDLVEIREELMEYGYIRRHHTGIKKAKITSRPLHYLSSDGFHIYVGKNNYQNEELTFKFASGNDWWFHAKGIPGSHVIVKSDGKEMPDRVYEEAGGLAAYYSKNRTSDKVEVDYIQKKNLKKVTGAAPGFVIYHTNYSLLATPSCSLSEVK